MESSNVLTLFAQKQTELQNELFDEWKRKLQPYNCNPDWMKIGGQIPWNAIVICEMSQISWQTGKLRERRFGNHLKDQSFHLVQCWNISQTPRERQREFISSEREYHQDFSRICFDRGANLERTHSDCWHWRIEKVVCIIYISQKTWCERTPDNPQRRRICISCGRWFSNIIRNGLWIPRTHTETGIHCKERESQRGISRR